MKQSLNDETRPAGAWMAFEPDSTEKIVSAPTKLDTADISAQCPSYNDATTNQIQIG